MAALVRRGSGLLRKDLLILAWAPVMVAGPSTVQGKKIEGVCASVLALEVVGADLPATSVSTSPTRRKGDAGV